MTPDKCPHCSAEKDTNSDNWFQCDSRFAEDSGHVYRSPLCRERSARQKAEEELEQWKQKYNHDLPAAERNVLAIATSTFGAKVEELQAELAKAREEIENPSYRHLDITHEMIAT